MSFLLSPSYEDAELTSHEEIQAEFGETWVHIPCAEARANTQPEPDPRRPRYAVTGIFGWEHKISRLGMEETGVSNRDPVLYVMSTALRYRTQYGDRFERCKTGDLFQVTDEQRDSASGVEIPLVMMGLMP